jgi:hypothetical protein
MQGAVSSFRAVCITEKHPDSQVRQSARAPPAWSLGIGGEGHQKDAEREGRFRSAKISRKGSECPIDELENPKPAENILHQQPKKSAT